MGKQPEQQMEAAEQATQVCSDAECIMCCEIILPKDSLSLECGHIFHASCLQKWLAKKPTCPMCRKDASVQVILSCDVCNKQFPASRYSNIDSAQAARKNHLRASHQVYDDESSSGSDYDYDYDDYDGESSYDGYDDEMYADGFASNSFGLLEMLRAHGAELNLPPELLDELMHQHMYATDTLGSEFDMCEVCGEHFYHDEYDSPRVASQACAQHRSAAHSNHTAEAPSWNSSCCTCSYCNQQFGPESYASSTIALREFRKHMKEAHPGCFQCELCSRTFEARDYGAGRGGKVAAAKIAEKACSNHQKTASHQGSGGLWGSPQLESVEDRVMDALSSIDPMRATNQSEPEQWAGRGGKIAVSCSYC